MRAIMKTTTKNPLEKAIWGQSAEWLEANCPDIFDALQQEMRSGKTLQDIRRILQRTFGNDLRDAFVLRVLQAAEWLMNDEN